MPAQTETALMMPIIQLFIVVGMIILSIGIVQFFGKRARLAKYFHAQGTVIEFLPQRSEGVYVTTHTQDGVKVAPKYRYRPVIQFTSHSGKSFRFQENLAIRPAPFQIGEQVRVVYNPENPRQAQIDQFIYLWFEVIMVVSFGLFFIGMGALGLLLSNSR